MGRDGRHQMAVRVFITRTPTSPASCTMRATCASWRRGGVNQTYLRLIGAITGFAVEADGNRGAAGIRHSLVRVDGEVEMSSNRGAWMMFPHVTTGRPKKVKAASMTLRQSSERRGHALVEAHVRVSRRVGRPGRRPITQPLRAPCKADGAAEGGAGANALAD